MMSVESSVRPRFALSPGTTMQIKEVSKPPKANTSRRVIQTSTTVAAPPTMPPVRPPSAGRTAPRALLRSSSARKLEGEALSSAILDTNPVFSAPNVHRASSEDGELVDPDRLQNFYKSVNAARKKMNTVVDKYEQRRARSAQIARERKKAAEAQQGSSTQAVEVEA
eukprot:Colp12_sorted_trinity150504_noHs@12714